MTSSELYIALDYVNHTREKRAFYAQQVLEQPELYKPLLEIMFLDEGERSEKAAWLAEYAVKSNITVILPHLDLFTAQMHTVHRDAAVRPVAKICEYLALAYYKEKHRLTRKSLKPTHRQKMIETGFDWMITPQKVAVKAYTMTTLFYLGTEEDWVHPELERIMYEGYASGSAAFKARCRHITEALKNYRKL